MLYSGYFVSIKSGKRKRFALSLTEGQDSFFDNLIKGCTKESVDARLNWDQIIKLCKEALNLET